MSPAPVESFPFLDAVPYVAAGFIRRIQGVDTSVERAEAMARLAPHHRDILGARGLGTFPLVNAEQVHGAKVAVVEEAFRSGTQSLHPLPGADGLATRDRGVTLGIYVADCAPVWIVTRDGSAGALIHSGRKGTELGIVPAGILALCSLGDLQPEDLFVFIGPCIRPPCYEIDFAAEIRRQSLAAGVTEVHDSGICTACHPELYYSYRRERGLTGRMLATLTLLPSS